MLALDWPHKISLNTLRNNGLTVLEAAASVGLKHANMEPIPAVAAQPGVPSRNGCYHSIGRLK